ncbi:MAG: ROK family protein [Chloroflexota bacterium]
MNYWGGIELGGTKCVCAIGTGPDDLRAEIRIPTTTPAETLSQALDFFDHHQALYALTGLGIGSSGPLDLDTDSETYGWITTSSKPGWAKTNLVGRFQRALQMPVTIDTDVNVAALGEQQWGAARGISTFIYLTVGTGIGGGGMVNGQLIHGLLHPEMGHMRIPHDWEADPYPGFCPFHGDCFQGLTAGPALLGRWGQRGETLPAAHPAWPLEAHYLALGLVNYICVLSPQRIVLGGGVMEQHHLFPLIRQEVKTLFNGYLQVPEILDMDETYIVPPQLGQRAGVLGAIALAQRAFPGRKNNGEL